MGFGLLRRDHTRLFENDPVRMALELFSKENRIERDLVCWDLRDPQLVEKSLARRSEFLDERVVGGFVVQYAARVACDMAGNEVYVLLIERVKRI